jgi:ATP-dependent 26S proteasome regulatory subunit
MTDLVGVGLPAEITKHEQEKKLWTEQCATMSHAAVLDMISSLNASIALTRSETNRIQEHESGFKSTELKKVHRTQIKRREQKLSYCIHYLIKRISHDEKDASDFDKCVVEMSQEYSALKYDLQRLRSLENPNGFGSGREEDQMASLQARIDDCIMNVTGFKQEDAIGCDEAIKMIHTAIMSARFPQLGQAPLTRMLLYGPPGVGKTHVVKVIASMFKLTMLSITPSAVMSKWQGDSAKLIRLVFSTAIRLAPSLVFIDELDGIARESGEDHRSGEEYNQNKSALLVGFNELDAYNKKTDSNGNLVNQNKQVFFIGATNHRKNLIGALHRRLERHIELKAPDAEARAKMFKHFLGDAAPHITDEVSLFDRLATLW